MQNEAEKMQEIAGQANKGSYTQRDIRKSLKQIRRAARGGHYDCIVSRSWFFRGWTLSEAEGIAKELQGMGFQADPLSCYSPGYFLYVSWEKGTRRSLGSSE